MHRESNRGTQERQEDRRDASNSRRSTSSDVGGHGGGLKSPQRKAVSTGLASASGKKGEDLTMIVMVALNESKMQNPSIPELLGKLRDVSTHTLVVRGRFDM
jgi:hypothetical protein